MKRFFVTTLTEDGGVQLHPMKTWLRQHPSEVPPGLDATATNSHGLRDGLRARGWTVHESDTDVRLIRPGDERLSASIDAVIGGVGEDQVSDDLPDTDAAFGLEHQLRDFLAQNLGAIRWQSGRLRLYVDPTGRDGVEYPTATGPIDILAIDDSGNLVVFELKRARTADRAIGQLTRYMGWVKHTIGRDVGVRGVIVARDIDQRLRYAASVIPNVELYEYAVEFHLKAATVAV